MGKDVESRVEHVKKGAVVLKSKPKAADMELINAQAIRTLTEDEVFLFRLAAADDQVDRDYEHLSAECLEGLAKLFVGRPVISDHCWSASGQVARVYAAAVEEDGGVKRLILSCYMLRSASAQPTIDAIEAGILREASVGVAVSGAVCDICGADKAKDWCEHRPGQSYGGTLCTVELRGAKDAYEVSFVAVPAQREAGVVKAYAGDAAPNSSDLARRKAIAAWIELENVKFTEEVPSV